MTGENMFEEKVKRFDPHPLFYAPIQPFLDELMARFQEAATSGSGVLNLGCTHPRGFFPAQVLTRRPIRDILKDAKSKGWVVDRSTCSGPTSPCQYFVPPGFENADLTTCDLTPYQSEIDRRHNEARAQVESMRASGRAAIAIVETTRHSRGDIPPTIMSRLERRKDPKWRTDTDEQIRTLYGDANKAEAQAKNMRERADGIASKPDGTGDPTNLLRGAQDLLQKAEVLRAHARFLKSEMGD